jgi:hypothetical protein
MIKNSRQRPGGGLKWQELKEEIKNQPNNQIQRKNLA